MPPKSKPVEVANAVMPVLSLLAAVGLFLAGRPDEGHVILAFMAGHLIKSPIPAVEP